MMHRDEKRQLEDLRSDLLREFGEELTAEVVAARFDEIVADFDGAAVRTFVPVLVQRRVRQALVSQRRA